MNEMLIVVGEEYRGELLMCDYGFKNLNEDGWYVLLESGEVKEVE